MFFSKNVNYKNILFFVIAIFILFIISKMQNVAILAFGSYVLACSLMPAADRLSEKMPRSYASTLVVIATILMVILVLIPVISISFQEIHQVINNIPGYVSSVIKFLSNKTIMGKSLIEFINIDSITSGTTQMASNLVNKSIDFTMGFLETITVIITISVIVFYMLNEKYLIRDSVLLLFPPKLKTKAKEVYEAIENKIGGYVLAQILSMTTVAIFTALGFMVLNVQYAILLGLIAGILDIIPIAGPTIALALGILCASPQGWVIILLTVFVYLAAQWISNNFVRPLVFGKFLDLHPLVVIFAFLISAQFLGVWGVILSPAIAALVLTLFDELYIKTINKEQ